MVFGSPQKSNNIVEFNILQTIQLLNYENTSTINNRSSALFQIQGIPTIYISILSGLRLFPSILLTMFSKHWFKFKTAAIGYGSVAVWMGPNWMKAHILACLLCTATEMDRIVGLIQVHWKHPAKSR